MKLSSDNALSRRTALAGAGVAGVAAVAAAVLPGQSAAPAVAAPDAVKAAPAEAGGYRLTEHIQRYYSTARA